ncbi:MAG: T9SS type A sorting domain-containing protein [Candidatus Marinimicrobia bacterium]|nr:T9SS type A sorting domain-containing protein [Candidatus Neomarinimicrobiota bacterium]
MWDEERKDPAIPRHFCFEGIDPPTQNNITTENNHPKINWTFSSIVGAEPTPLRFNVYRKLLGESIYSQIGTENVDILTSSYSFVDLNILISRPGANPIGVAYYKISTVYYETGLDMESGMSNVKSINFEEEGGDPSQKIAAESNRNINIRNLSSSAYPNPFNPTTTISYELPSGGHVELKVLDIFGREVVTLKNGNESSGRYSVRWNGKNRNGETAASGMYFYRLLFKGEQKVGKLMLMR